MPAIDYQAAGDVLRKVFIEAERDLLTRRPPKLAKKAQTVMRACDVVFASRTQAYREVLLGCTLARLQDKRIDIRQPYVKQSDRAFNGRTLDERVVNPFLHDSQIPCSKGPYLSVFRRSVKFDYTTRSGLRDPDAYDSFLELIAYLESLDADAEIKGFLRYLLYRFAELREASSIPLARLHRISLEQHARLIAGLLATPSGGRFPVMLVVAALECLKESLQLDWQIDWQGINVADQPAGLVGDVTVSEGERTVLALEVTERPIDRSRVVATFRTKIAPHGIEDYLFVGTSSVAAEARRQAHQYFSQGHEVNFVPIQDWIVMLLATLGKTGRATFGRVLVETLEASDVPQQLKVAWNEQIASIVGARNS